MGINYGWRFAQPAVRGLYGLVYRLVGLLPVAAATKRMAGSAAATGRLGQLRQDRHRGPNSDPIAG
jgi:hypothetical protein